MENVDSFKDINSIDDLLEFLEIKGSNHRNYYHYTNKNGLKGMLKSRKLYISRGDQMNDKQELTKGDVSTWEKVYLASFNFGEEENMAMWGLYGVPHEDAIRITIPGKLMKEWVNSIKEIYRVETPSPGVFVYHKLPDFSRATLTDVVYASGKRNDGNDFKLRRGRSVKHINRNGPLGRVSDNKKMTGYIKNIAWSYENEVRIRVETKESIDCKLIAIDIPNEVLNSFELLYGPGYEGISEYLVNNTEILKYDYSGFKCLVHYREKCWFCDYTYQKKL